MTKCLLPHLGAVVPPSNTDSTRHLPDDNVSVHTASLSSVKLPFLETSSMRVLRRRLLGSHLDIRSLHVLLRQGSADFLVRLGVRLLAVA